MKIYSRREWGAKYQDGDLSIENPVKKIRIHHSVTTQLSKSASVSQEMAEMLNIEKIGQNRFGTGISYNFIVFPSGRVYAGVSPNRRGTHDSGENSTTIAICFAGMYHLNTPSSKSITAARNLVSYGIMKKWWSKASSVTPHSDHYPTQCPGKYLIPHIPEIRKGLLAATASTVKPIAEDGLIGPLTIAALQREFGTPVDGKVSSQEVANKRSELTGGWEWVSNPVGSQLIMSMQTRFKKAGYSVGTIDGIAGPKFWSAFMSYYGCSKLPCAIKKMQAAYNQGIAEGRIK